MPWGLYSSILHLQILSPRPIQRRDSISGFRSGHGVPLLMPQRRWRGHACLILVGAHRASWEDELRLRGFDALLSRRSHLGRLYGRYGNEATYDHLHPRRGRKRAARGCPGGRCVAIRVDPMGDSRSHGRLSPQSPAAEDEFVEVVDGGGGAAPSRRGVRDIARGAYQYEPPTLEDLGRAREIDAKFSNLKLGLTDASIAALGERLGVRRILTTDSDFLAVRVGKRWTVIAFALPRQPMRNSRSSRWRSSVLARRWICSCTRG